MCCLQPSYLKMILNSTPIYFLLCGSFKTFEFTVICALITIMTSSQQTESDGIWVFSCVSVILLLF